MPGPAVPQPDPALAQPDAGRTAEAGPADAGTPDEDVAGLAGRLFDLARTGEGDRLAAYVDGGVPVNLTNGSGDTLLMLAAYHGHAAAVRALLARGAEPDRPNDRGQTALGGAVFKGEDDVCRALVDAGADPDAGTPTARAAAAVFGRADLATLFGDPPGSPVE